MSAAAVLPAFPHEGNLAVSDIDVEKDIGKTASDDASSEKSGRPNFVDEVKESIFAAFTYAQQAAVLKKVRSRRRRCLCPSLTGGEVRRSTSTSCQSSSSHT
jgi:hypothetical protein